ncbi:hypothetical protein [Evansella cellulosilytica]|uniref:Lipoprotein n=1 Tax=Evansella cellulosilytica (strain ATCC 21833 / DSM 2522 / FERM P-1141 / JCM 9156 / N-4) TaxID=649639 RepID=E6TRU5_EVAC2|nr:hypothetical protein [Evansella cellulosilytica]ADU29468.1 hypothetical protein Bcell_1203 [Evansella cellulosilytica DSM 2522]
MGKQVILYFVIVLFLTGCDREEEENSINVMVFSGLPFSLEDSMYSYFDSVEYDEELDINVKMFLPSREKLIIEMVAREGDIYLVEDFMFPIIFDPVILHPLDSIAFHVDEEKQHVGENEQTGEENIYAITVNGDAKLFQELGVNVSTDFVAVMMEDTPSHSYGLKLMEAIVN